ncbi:hypothetical protein X975_14033, partial [Stegodyphus mimosarum]
MLYRVEAWTPAWPIHPENILTLEKFEKLGAYCPPEKSNIGLQDFILIPHTSHRASVKGVERCAAIKHDARPDHYTATAIIVAFADTGGLAEAKIDFKGGELTLNMKPIEAKNDKPPELDLQHLPAEEKEKIQGLERAEEFKMSDIQNLIREAAGNIEMAQRKQKLYYDQKRRGVKYNVGNEVLKIKHNLSNAPEEKRRKQNGQGKPNVSKRTAESSDRCLRSKKHRMQPENQRPEYSRKRTRAQERRAQSTKRPAEEPPLQGNFPRMQRRNFKRKRDEHAPKEQQPKARKLNQATTYSTFKVWAKKRMDDHNKIRRIS